jgi:hypothetical protein
MAGTATISAAHASAPYDECEDRKSNRPPDHEAQDRQHDPGGLAEFIELCGDGHADPSRVNVNNIYIAI